MSESASLRLGLALSGGGFRASLFHLGLLARMAETGLLRHVEVISCVSGGSIVGAAFYLKLKQLLEAHAEDELTDAMYVEAVGELERHFLSAVQKNLRMRTFANLLDNARIARRNFSRSDAIGKLYEKFIYRDLIDTSKFPGRRIHMADLCIQPKGAPENFDPRSAENGNAQRQRAKVPLLILNATSLNSGHDWIFTTHMMGENPPRSAHFADFDKKDRYRRVAYDEIDPKARDPWFSLGAAVGASAAVPGLFPPLAVSNLYHNRRVQLVDGGVFDNQGITSLLDPDYPCNAFVISDASGQSQAYANPNPMALSVLSDTTSILMARVREEVVSGLLSHPQYANTTCYIHLTRGLLASQLDAAGQQPQTELNQRMREGVIPCQEDYGVNENVQHAIAKLRTDLDTFTDTEAHALQADAYLMSKEPLRKLAATFACQPSTGARWQFASIIPELSKPNSDIVAPLHIGKKLFFKPLFLAWELGWAHVVLLAICSLPLIALLVGYVVAAYFGLSLWLAPRSIADLFRLDTMAAQRLLKLVLPALGAALLNLALVSVVDRLLTGSGRWVSLARKVASAAQEGISLVLRFIVFPLLVNVPVSIYLVTVDRLYVQMGRRDVDKPGSVRPGDPEALPNPAE